MACHQNNSTYLESLKLLRRFKAPEEVYNKLQMPLSDTLWDRLTSSTVRLKQHLPITLRVRSVALFWSINVVRLSADEKIDWHNSISEIYHHLINNILFYI